MQPEAKQVSEERLTAEPELRGFHWIFAAPMSLWCLFWLAINGYNYIRLTWRLFRVLGWFSFALLINPCFWIWLALFSSSVWAPFYMFMMPWGKYGPELSRTKVAIIVVFVPALLGLALEYIGPYFYPVWFGGEGGVFLRLIPILGGRGYN